MAVEACSTPNMMDDMDDDEEAPMVFKRSSSSRQNQINVEKKKQSSQKSDGQPSVQSGVRPASANGESSRAEKGKAIPSSKTPPIKSPLASPKASNPSGKASPIPSHGKASPVTSYGKASPVTSHGKAPPVTSHGRASSMTSPGRASSMTSPGRASPITSPGTSSRISSSSTNKQQNHPRPPIVKQAKPPVPAAKGNSEVSDDDEKPLSARLPTGSAKRDPNIDDKKGDGSSSVQKPAVHDSDDSEDEKPLSHRFSGKSSLGESTSAAKVRQNGSALSDRPVSKSLSLSNKRPSSEVKPTNQSSFKKPKLSSPTTSVSQKSASVKAEPKVEDDEDDDVPLSQRGKKSQSASIKPKDEDEDDHVPISQRTKNPTSSGSKAAAPAKKLVSSSLHKTNKNSKKVVKKTSSSKMLPGSGDGQKWTTLVHNGVIFPAPYKPHGVKMLYKGKPVTLTPEQEEVATMFAVMLETEYMNKPRFKENFFSDWKKLLGKNHTIQNLDDCDFTPIHQWHLAEKEKKKQMTTEEKKALKAEKDKLEEKYQWAFVDGVKEKVGNFRVEPPGLFRGRGEHPKMGKLKKRIYPGDIVINIGKDAPIPECPIPGERWKEVRHDNTVIWLAYWVDPINQREFKYVQLAASSSLKGQSDKQKYEKARLLKDHIHRIRASYTKDFTSKDPTKKQIAVATYLIDKLALRAGNEKDDDEADTVGCCTLKVENVEIAPPSTLKFDFLGKDSIRYQNEVEVEPAVFEAIKQFRKGKKGSDDLFDMLDTSKLNAHLKQLMDGLTAKVFRTYNASITLDDMLRKDTKGGDVAEKIVVYNSANKEVAIICNHQRTVSKTHSAQMARLDEKIDELKAVMEELKNDLSRAKKGKPPAKSADGKPKRNLAPEALEKKIAQTNVRIEKMERDKLTKEDLKTVALGTSKINYLDPRITVAWCKRREVPIEKIFNKSLLAKFSWAMDVDPSFRF